MECLICVNEMNKKLTNKLRGSKDVLELISCFDLMSNSKVNQFNPGVWDVLVQQHDIFRLEENSYRINMCLK